MPDIQNKHPHRFSLTSRGARYHFKIGIALITVIPLIALYIILTADFWRNCDNADCWRLAICFFLFIGGIAGYILLRKYPINIRKIREHMEHAIKGEFPEKIDLLNNEVDISTIQKDMKLILDELKKKISIAEQEKQKLQNQTLPSQKLGSLRTMASGMAHDYNNMITAILGNVNIVLRDVPPESSARKNLQQIEATALRASDLTNQIMTYADRGKFLMEKINLSALVRNMEDLLNSTVSDNVNIIYKIDSDIPSINGDSTYIRQVIMNLVVNASDATIDKTGTVTVSTGTKYCGRKYLDETCARKPLLEQNYVFVEISDDGCGMSSDVKAKIFDPFFTTKIRGKGMGLSVAIGVICAHNGTIRVESEPDKGSTFTILIPTDTKTD
ncbi:sensor histidine kinase [Verrucomicrobiota bacterium]